MIDIKDIHGKIIASLDCDSLYRADLSGLDLTEADLRGADLYYAKMVRTKLRGADLRGANLTAAYLVWTDLSEALTDHTTKRPTEQSYRPHYM